MINFYMLHTRQQFEICHTGIHYHNFAMMMMRYLQLIGNASPVLVHNFQILSLLNESGVIKVCSSNSFFKDIRKGATYLDIFISSLAKMFQIYGSKQHLQGRNFEKYIGVAQSKLHFSKMKFLTNYISSSEF